MKNIVTYCFLIMTACLMVLGCQRTKPVVPESEDIARKAEIEAAFKVKDSTIASLEADNDRLRQASETSVAKQEEITKSFKPVYEKNKNATDSAELAAYTLQLLARFQAIPFERN